MTNLEKLREKRIEAYNLNPIYCKQCGKKLEYEKIAKDKRTKFCNSSCAATYNNRKFIKRKRIYKKCIKCTSPTRTANSIYCAECKPIKSVDLTLGEAIYITKHKSSAYAMVRSRARIVAKKLGMNHCLVCGYNKHTEICHIHPINKFDHSTLLSVINNPKNLLPLCPTHHWEYDNNQLETPLAGLEPT